MTSLTQWTCVHAQSVQSGAHQAPLSTRLSRQEYWSGLPCPPPGDLSYPGVEPVSLTSPAFSGRFFVTNAIREALNGHEFEQTPRDGEGQGSLTCCSPWSCKESDTTEQLNNNKAVPTPAPVRGLQKSAYFLERK